MKCKYCDKETKNPSFCSRSCSAKETNKTPKRTCKPKKCKRCTNLVQPNTSKKYSSLCPSCQEKIFINGKTLEEVTNLAKYQLHSQIRGFARRILNKSDRAKICICGYSKHVEVCHIKAISSFSPDSLISEINDIDNLTYLCPNCHWEFDNGHFKL